MGKKMMILGASALQVPAIKKAKELGYKVILVDYDENAVGFSLADVKLVVSTMDQEEVYRQALIYQPDVVLTSTSDGPVRTAAYVNEKLGKRPDLSYRDSFCATVKSDMRKRLEENGVPIPEYYAAADFAGFRDAVGRLGGYCIVKPADNAGSRGVVLLGENKEGKQWQESAGQRESACVRQAESGSRQLGHAGQRENACVRQVESGSRQLGHAGQSGEKNIRPEECAVQGEGSGLKLGEEDLKAVYAYSRSHSRNGMVMVEEFMPGAEVSVEAITVEGETQIIAVTDKYITPPPYFVELAHCEPSRLDGKVQEQVRQVALRAVKAIGLCNGPSHTEIKVTPEGPKVVELAARLGGDFITSRLVPLSTGVDLVGASVELAAGEKADISPKWQRGAAIHFLQAKEGVIRGIFVDEGVYRLKGVEEVEIYKKAGDEMHGTKSSNDRLGHIITCADTPEEAMEAGKKAMGFITVEWEQREKNIKKR